MISIRNLKLKMWTISIESNKFLEIFKKKVNNLLMMTNQHHILLKVNDFESINKIIFVVIQ